MILNFIGTTELLLIGGLTLLIFGGKKLPEMMKGLGKGVREFKNGMREVSDEINSERMKGTDVPDENDTPTASPK